MFEIGKLYKRKEDIHLHLGGQRQGGISTPSAHPVVLLFTGDAGFEYGYEDKFHTDGTFWYTGEGQVGDMEMLRGNSAIRDHIQNGKRLHLFEYVKKAYVSYVGEARYVDHHIASRPDREDSIRDVIVFHLEMLPTGYNGEADSVPNKQTKLSRILSLAELRALAKNTAPAKATAKQTTQTVLIRSEAVRLYALKRAEGICEGCEQPAPFEGKNGPFLEVHHLHRLSDGGPDEPENVAAICPNCHRRAHVSKDHAKYNEHLVARITKIEIALHE
jgi:5-methylcytosine-specific restriction protein A